MEKYYPLIRAFVIHCRLSGKYSRTSIRSYVKELPQEHQNHLKDKLRIKVTEHSDGSKTRDFGDDIFRQWQFFLEGKIETIGNIDTMRYAFDIPNFSTFLEVKEDGGILLKPIKPKPEK